MRSLWDLAVKVVKPEAEQVQMSEKINHKVTGDQEEFTMGLM